MKKSFLKIFLSATSVIAFVSLSTVSCVDAGAVRNNRQYIKSFNQPNFLTTNDFSFNTNKTIKNDTDALVFSPIINFEYRDKVVLDYVNNNVLVPTKKIWRLNLASFITIDFDNGRSKVYNNDNFDISLTPPDSANGYKNPILDVSSNDDLSINNPQFKKDLSNAKDIQITFKQVEYVNYMGQKTGDFLSANDFLLSLSKKENKNKYKEVQNAYGIDISVNANNNLIITSSKKMLESFFAEELTRNMMFNPTSTSYLKSLNKTIDEYKPTLKEARYLSYYVLNSNDIEKQKYIKNQFSANDRFVNDPNTLTEIILNFNSVPIDVETYRLQVFKAYRQNLISESNFDIFNSAQQRDIMNFSSSYGLTLQLPSSTLSSNINSLYNLNFNKKLPYDFNEAFSKLVYGTQISYLNEVNKKYFYEDKNSYLFRLYLSNILNNLTISDSLGFNSYWNNLSLSQTTLTGTDKEFTNYKNLSDASLWATQSVVPNYSLTNEASTNLILEKDKSFSIANILDYQKRLKTSDFDFIKANIKLLLNNFYEKNSQFSNEKISFTLPLFSSVNGRTSKNASEIQKLINSIDNRLDVKVIISDQIYNQRVNSFVKHFSVTYTNNTLENYFDTILDKTDLIYAIIYEDSNNSPILKELKKEILQSKSKDEFINMFINNEAFKLEIKTKILQFIATKTNFEQVTIINSISRIFPIPISLNLFSSDNSFKRVIVQNNLIKPLNDLGFNQFQDIKVF